MKCPNCKYENERKKWTMLQVSGIEQTWLIAYKYDKVKDEQRHIGSVNLYACPECNTVIFNGR